ncbi:MAG: helix-turn-helix transcriptional regulator [Thermotogae bacterium]|nr:helix-turn-helix transcriptional regulator [Thermotogota bacterium]
MSSILYIQGGGKVRVNVRRVRRERGLTQEELARKVGVSRQTIVNVEQGRYKPSILLALKIARVLDTDVETLFKLEEVDWR